MRVRLVLLSVAVLALVLGLSGAASAAWPDVGPRTPYYDAIIDLEERGIVSGFPDGTFGPSFNVKRMQFAKMIVKTLGIEPSGEVACPFVDVPKHLDEKDPLYPASYVAVCAGEKITVGKTPTTFAPYDPITREQLVTMITRAADLAEPPANYAPPFTQAAFTIGEHYLNARKAAYHGLLDGLENLGSYAGGGYSFRPSANRGEVCLLLYNLLNISEVTWRVTQVTDDAYQETSLAISDGLLFYNAWGGSSGDIFVRKLATGATRQITNDTRSDGMGWSATAGTRAVWQSADTDGDAMLLYSYATGTTTQILPPDWIHSSYERISEDYVVWDEHSHIAWYEIATGQTSRAKTSRGWHHDDISTEGHLAVFTENDGYDEEVYLLNLLTGSITRLTDDFQNQVEPVLSSGKVFWVTERVSPEYGNDELRMYDLTSRTESLVEAATHIGNLQAENGRVAWYCNGLKVMDVAGGSPVTIKNGGYEFRLSDSCLIWSGAVGLVRVHDLPTGATYRINLPGYRVIIPAVGAKDEVAFVGQSVVTGIYDVFVAKMEK